MPNQASSDNPVMGRDGQKTPMTGSSRMLDPSSHRCLPGGLEAGLSMTAGRVKIDVLQNQHWFRIRIHRAQIPMDGFLPLTRWKFLADLRPSLPPPCTSHHRMSLTAFPNRTPRHGFRLQISGSRHTRPGARWLGPYSPFVLPSPLGI